MQVLDSLAKRLDLDAVHNPYVEAHLRYMLGRSYHDAERFVDAQPQFKTALELLRSVYGRDHSKVTDTLRWLTINSKMDASLAPEGEAFARESLAIYQRMAKDGLSDMVANVYSELSAVLLAQGKSAEAVDASERAIAIEREVSGANAPWTLWHMALCYGAVQKTPQQLECMEQASELFELNKDTHGRWICQTALSDVYAQQGRIEEAFQAATLGVSLADLEGIHRLDRRFRALVILAARYRDILDRENEITCLREVMDLAGKAKDVNVTDLCLQKAFLAQALEDAGQSAEASLVARELLSTMQQLRSSQGTVWSESIDHLAMANLSRMSGGDRNAAEKALERVQEAQAFREGEASDWTEAFANHIRARALAVLGRRDEAMACARAFLAAAPVDWIDGYGSAEELLFGLLESANKRDDAIQVLEDGIRHRVAKLSDTHLATDLARLRLAQKLYEQSRYSDAQNVLEQASTRLLKCACLSANHKKALFGLLADLCRQRGEAEQEAAWRKQLAEISVEKAPDSGH